VLWTAGPARGASVVDGGPADGGLDGAAAEAGAPPDAAAPDTAAADAVTAARPEPVRAAGPAPVRLRGTVLEKGTRHPIAGVAVSIDGARDVEADGRGVFEASVAPGRHALRIHDPRYEDLAADLVAEPPSGLEATFRLVPRAEIPVYETKVQARRPREPSVAVEGDEARQAPGSGGDPLHILQSLPGVSQVVWPLALYAIRGANPGNTGFFIDDMRVPALFHFALGPSIIHPYLISRVEFFPGGYPARYSGYVSGIVAASTDTPPESAPLTSADVRLYDAGALLSRPFDGDRGRVAVAARYSYAGLVASRLSSDVTFGYADYELLADHPLAGGRAALLLLGSFDQIDIQSQQIGDGALNFHRGQLRWTRALGPGRLTLSAAFGTDHTRSTLYGDPITMKTLSATPHLRYTLGLGSALELEAGADAEGERFATVIAGDTGVRLGQSDLARPRTLGVAGAYVSLALRLGTRLEVVPAVRVSSYVEQGVTSPALEPRLTARLRVTDAASLKVALGRFAQMPSLPLDLAGFEGFGLRDFGLQRSVQTSAGAELTLGGGVTFIDVTGFYQALRVTDLGSLFSQTITAADFLQVRIGRAYGGELLIRRDVGRRLHGWLAYTLSWSERTVDGVRGPSDWDQRHILNLLASYDLRHGYGAGFRFHYNSGRPFPLPNETGDREYQRLPPFYQLDLRAEKRWLFERWRLEVYVELGNATLTRNVTNLQPRTSAPPQQEGFRIVLPAVGVHAEF
jgi:TonB-dependent Receptor Plug Domain